MNTNPDYFREIYSMEDKSVLCFCVTCNTVIPASNYSELLQHAYLSHNDLFEIARKEKRIFMMIHETGAVKLCTGCGRFMEIDDDRKLIPHKKFLTENDCLSGV